MSGERLALAVLISGRGSNMAAIARACAAGQIPARIVRVIADRAGAAGIALAGELGLEVSVLPADGFRDRADFEAALRSLIDSSGARLVVLAGFMRILSPQFTAQYAGAMLNIHPSLLPRYPGLHTHARVLEAGDREHGATVHFVTSELDAGPILLQARVPVLAGDSVASLSARVQEQEHIIYPRVIGWIAAGRLRWAGEALLLDGRPLPAAAHEEP
ncbi:MAG TPA: phosphoribosylglycinamide formyltransferase [Steroidobacteraceae bacterium]|nr:phosphoribosylglycinamide formyltransferase [Steroidobacteraceae bacterium]